MKTRDLSHILDLAGEHVLGDSLRAVSDDRELLTRWRTGDNNAGRQLFQIYGPMITAYFQRKLFDTAEVAKLVNETFYACMTTKSAFVGPAAAVRGYLFGIAHNKLREHVRRQVSEARLIAPGVDADQVAELTLGEVDPRDPSDFAEQLEERKQILRALRRIPLDYQLIIELSYWEGLTNAEIAQALGLKVGTVASRLRLGKERLEQQLRAQIDSPVLLETTTMNLAAWIERVRAHAAGGRGE
jgi:RNA polymerase sigma factor (sigma-70 family)